MNSDSLIEAAKLCICTNGCTTGCYVCMSPAWKQQGCIRVLYNDPTHLPDEKAESAIEFVEEVLGVPLVPWQAELLRYIINHPGERIELRRR